MKRDEQLWAEWLRLHRDALTGVRDLEAETRADLTTEINGILADIGHQMTHGIGTQFDSVKAKVEAALSATTSSAIDVHTIANLALLASGDNSALSNSTFEVKRREILQRDRDGSYIPACTRNVFLKYYTESGAQQIHYWGSADRAAYLAAIVASVEPYLIPTEVTA